MCDTTIRCLCGEYFINWIELRTVGVGQTLPRHQRWGCDRIPQPGEQRSRMSRLFKYLRTKKEIMFIMPTVVITGL